MALDKTDLAILRALADDGRATLQDVADKIGLRRPSVHARVKKLEAEGVLRGYHADVDPDAVGAGLVAYVFLRVAHGKGNDCMQACGKVGDALRKIPEVVEFHTLAGEDDAVAKVRAKDVRDLERVVMRQISGVPGVDRVRTNVVLSTHIERQVAVRAVPAIASTRPR
jgi:DNA-binding Lrp family transcriptional regulator